MTRERRTALLNDEGLSHALRSLRPRVQPLGLRTSLRVLASRELRRRTGIVWLDRVHLFFDNLMRPLALPFAGGIFSTVLLFSMCLAPSYPMRGQGSFDVPITGTTQPTVKGTGPILPTGNDVTVYVTIDRQGRMVDYAIVSGGNGTDNDPLRRNIEIQLLLTEFNPATTAFGQPTSGKMRLSLRSSSIDVRG